MADELRAKLVDLISRKAAVYAEEARKWRGVNDSLLEYNSGAAGALYKLAGNLGLKLDEDAACDELRKREAGCPVGQ